VHAALQLRERVGIILLDSAHHLCELIADECLILRRLECLRLLCGSANNRFRHATQQRDVHAKAARGTRDGGELRNDRPFLYALSPSEGKSNATQRSSVAPLRASPIGKCVEESNIKVAARIFIVRL